MLTSGAKKIVAAPLFGIFFHCPVFKLIIYSTPFPLRNVFICTHISCSKDFDG